MCSSDLAAATALSLLAAAVSAKAGAFRPSSTLVIGVDESGRVEVSLTDGEFANDDPHLPYCNTYWGGVLQRLRAYVEKA